MRVVGWKFSGRRITQCRANAKGISPSSSLAPGVITAIGFVNN